MNALAPILHRKDQSITFQKVLLHLLHKGKFVYMTKREHSLMVDSGVMK